MPHGNECDNDDGGIAVDSKWLAVVWGGRVAGIDSNNTGINRCRNLNCLLISVIDPNAITQCL